MQQRLIGLGVQIDWQRLQRITDIRNNVEHYYYDGSRQQIREVVSEACVVIRQLVMDVLQHDSTKLIGRRWWERLFRVKEVFDQEHKACRQTLARVRWPSAAQVISGRLECPECGSTLLRQLDPTNAVPLLIQFRCTACGMQTDGGGAIEAQIGRYWVGNQWWWDANGVIDVCASCSYVSFVVDQNGCAVCGYELSVDTVCSCGEPLTPADYGVHKSWCGHEARRPRSGYSNRAAAPADAKP
jgi:hypothetical protein